jgi:hypothetical protein
MPKSTLAIPTPASAGVSRWNVRNRICRAIIAGATVLSLAASALTIEPAGAGAAGMTIAPIGSARARANRHRSSRCWQVRPIYSASGAWLDNRRVNVCH